MAASAPERSYVVGETIEVRTRLAKPGTKLPVDANVAITKLQRVGGSAVEPIPAFIREAEGDYATVLATEGWVPGTYDLVVRVDDGPEKVVLVADRFVLRPL